MCRIICDFFTVMLAVVVAVVVLLVGRYVSLFYSQK